MKSETTKTCLQFFFLFLSIAWYSGCMTHDINMAGNLVPATADKDPNLPSVRLNGCTFHLETFGNPENPAIIFMSGGLADYRPFLSYTVSYGGRSLTDNYFLIFWDQRGKGLTERFDRENISFDRYQEDIEAIVEHFCGDGPVIFIAHSFGGIFAARYMNRYPERIAGAVFLESGPFKSADSVHESDLRLHSEWLNDLMWCQQFVSPDNHDLADYNFAQAKCQAIQPEMHTRELTPFFRVGVAAQNWLDIEMRNIEFDYTDDLQKIKPEILLIAGAETERLGADYQRMKLKYFRKARIEIIAGAGHGDLIWADADKVVPIILNYLKSLHLKGEKQ